MTLFQETILIVTKVFPYVPFVTVNSILLVQSCLGIVRSCVIRAPHFEYLFFPNARLSIVFLTNFHQPFLHLTLSKFSRFSIQSPCSNCYNNAFKLRLPVLASYSMIIMIIIVAFLRFLRVHCLSLFPALVAKLYKWQMYQCLVR